MADNEEIEAWKKFWGLDKVAWHVKNGASYDEMKWAFDLLGLDRHFRTKRGNHARRQ